MVLFFNLIRIEGGGWVYLYSFICLSAGAVKCVSSCFATTLLHHAPPKVTSVLVLFSLWSFILIGWYLVGLYKLRFATSVVFPIAPISICCVMFTAKDSEVVDCGHKLIHIVFIFISNDVNVFASEDGQLYLKLLSIIIILSREEGQRQYSYIYFYGGRLESSRFDTLLALNYLQEFQKQQQCPCQAFSFNGSPRIRYRITKCHGGKIASGIFHPSNVTNEK